MESADGEPFRANADGEISRPLTAPRVARSKAAGHLVVPETVVDVAAPTADRHRARRTRIGPSPSRGR